MYCLKITPKLLMVLVVIFVVSRGNAFTLSCSYLDTFNSENILTFFLKKENDSYKYYYRGKERFLYISLVDDEKKLVLGVFEQDFDGIYIFDKLAKSFKMITVPFSKGKQEKIISGKCEEIL